MVSSLVSRHGRRLWEAQATLGQTRDLLIVLCKKNAIAERLIARLSALPNLKTLGYLFDKIAMQLPDLGGIETTLSQRNRHRAALIKFLYDSYQVTQLLICIDPAEFECIQDFCTDTASTRLLEINPDLSNLALTIMPNRWT